MEESIVKERPGVGVELVSRVQLRAILSGLAVTAGCLAVCMGICWAIGLSTFQPTVDHARGLLLGSVIWGAIALWISIFAGAFVAALVGRSLAATDGILHGLVVWGTFSALLGLVLVRMFSGLGDALILMTTAPGAAAQVPMETSATVLRFAHTIGVTTWLYWAGVVGSAFTAAFGGWLGAREGEHLLERFRRREPRPTPPVRPRAPQPAV